MSEKKIKEEERTAMIRAVIEATIKPASIESLREVTPTGLLSRLERYGYIRKVYMEDGEQGYLAMPSGRQRVGYAPEPAARVDRYVPTGIYRGEAMSAIPVRPGAADAFKIPSLHAGVRHERRVPTSIF
jgi:hypothetical protein